MFSNTRLPLLLCALSVPITTVRGADAAQEWAPFPSVVAAAQANRIPLDGIDSLAETNTINPGDSLTALVTLREKGNPRTQWLICLQAVAPAPREQLKTPTTTAVIHNTLGNKLKFVSVPTFVAVRTLGPFAEPGAKNKAKAADKTTRISLDKGFLALGLDHAAAALLRLKDDTNFTRLFEWGTTPFSETQIADARKFLDVWKLTPAEERALGGSQLALVSYLQTVRSTPGLEDIVAKVLELPSAWSLVRHGGVGSTLFRWQANGVELRKERPGSPRLYTVPMVLELNKQPALNLTLMVVKPQSPLLPCAGIITLVAHKPGDAETILMLHLMSARRAKASVE
jgi:hypothetical protein